MTFVLLHSLKQRMNTMCELSNGESLEDMPIMLPCSPFSITWEKGDGISHMKKEREMADKLLTRR